MAAGPDPTRRPDRRAFLFGGALLAGGGLPWLLQPRAAGASLPPDMLGRIIPPRIGDYAVSTVGGLVLPTEEELGNVVYDRIMTRVYVRPASPAVMVMIAMTDGQNAWRKVQRPNACYSAVGFSVGPERPLEVRGASRPIRASFFTARRPESVEHVLYWTRVGNSFPGGDWSRNWDIARANLAGERPPGVLLRLSVRETEDASALARLQSFHALLFSAMTPRSRAILLGDAA